MRVMFARALRFQSVLVMIGFFGAFDLALAQSKKLRPLHIALANHSVSMTSIYVAKHLGIFEGYGYDARVLVLEPRAGIGALLSGDLDCYSAIGSTARAALRGFASTASGVPFDGVHADEFGDEPAGMTRQASRRRCADRLGSTGRPFPDHATAQIFVAELAHRQAAVVEDLECTVDMVGE